MSNNNYDLIILGSGPAGCTAALYAAHANFNVALITGRERGGQLTKASQLTNWPALTEPCTGFDLMERLLQQLETLHVPLIDDEIKVANLTSSPITITGKKAQYTSKYLIIATGTAPKLLNIPGEETYFGKGVSTCAVCDGFFCRNKDVVIIGGGNKMANDALYLADLAHSVTIIHRREVLRADAALISQLKKRPNIFWRLNSQVLEVMGDHQEVTQILIQNNCSKQRELLKTSTVFLAIGVIPNNQLFTEQLALTADGYIKTGSTLYATQTSIPNVFAAGDIVAKQYHQAIIAAGSGCNAFLDLKNFAKTVH